MPKTTKDNDYSYAHSVQRFNERYGKDLTLKDYQDWCKSAKQLINGCSVNDMTIISKQIVNQKNTSYVIHYKLSYDLYFVYETERDTITTFLPPDSIKPHKLKKH